MTKPDEGGIELPMTILITGASGHLGEALCLTLTAQRRAFTGIDVKNGPFTTHVGDIADAAFAARIMKGVTAVLHTATLHKPHVVTHSNRQFPRPE